MLYERISVCISEVQLRRLHPTERQTQAEPILLPLKCSAVVMSGRQQDAQLPALKVQASLSAVRMALSPASLRSLQDAASMIQNDARGEEQEDLGVLTGAEVSNLFAARSSKCEAARSPVKQPL